MKHSVQRWLHLLWTPDEESSYLDDTVELCQRANSPSALQQFRGIDADDEVRKRYLCCER